MKTFIIQGGFEKVPLVKTTPSHKTLLPGNIGKDLIKVKMLNLLEKLSGEKYPPCHKKLNTGVFFTGNPLKVV